MGRKKEVQATEAGRRLGLNFLELRGRAGFSQQVAAERAGLHRVEVGLIEGGKRVPHLDTIVKLAGAVGVEPCELLRGMAWDLSAPREESK